MKKTVITCVTALLCVVAVCVSSVLGTNKIAESKIEAAKYNVSGSSNKVYSSSVTSVSDGDTADIPSDSEEIPTDTADDGQDADVSDDNTADDSSTDSSSASSTDSSSSTSTTNKTTSTTSASSSKPTTTAEILNYFNTSVNKVKTSAKGGVKNYEKNTQAGTFTLTGPFKVFSSAINSLVDKNMGEKEGDTNRKLSKADLKTDFPVENETWSSKLTTSNITSATLTEKNGNYVITIQVKSDAASTNPTHGSGNHGKAFSIVQVSTILDNAGPVKSLINGNVKIGYSNGKIVATIDPKTGNLTHANYYYVWTLEVAVSGTTVTAPFGIESDYTINW